MYLLTMEGNVATEPVCKQVNTSHGPETVLNFRFGADHETNKNKHLRVTATAWGKKAISMSPYVKYGQRLFLTGYLEDPKIYTNKEGVQQVELPFTIKSYGFLDNGTPKAKTSESNKAIYEPVNATVDYDTGEIVAEDDENEDDNGLPW